MIFINSISGFKVYVKYNILLVFVKHFKEIKIDLLILCLINIDVVSFNQVFDELTFGEIVLTKIISSKI